jgi:hypothetical protein
VDGVVPLTCVGVRGARADVRFDDTATLETDAAFPAAFFALLQYLYEHRPSDISGLKAPVCLHSS